MAQNHLHSHHSISEVKALIAQKTAQSAQDINLLPVSGDLQSALNRKESLIVLLLKDGHHLLLQRHSLTRPFAPINAPKNFSLRALASLFSGNYFICETNTQTLPEMASPLGYVEVLKVFWPRYIEIGVSGFVINFIGLLLPLFTSLIYDKVIGNHIPDTLWALVIGMVLFTILEITLRLIRSLTFEQMAAKADIKMEAKFWVDLMAARLNRLPPVGVLLSHYRSLTQARDFLSSQTMQAVADMPFLLLYLGVMIAIGGVLVFVPIVFAILLIAGYLIIHKPQEDYGRLLIKESGARINLLSEILRGQEWLKRNKMHSIFSSRWHKQATDRASTQARSRFWQSLGSVWSGLCITLASIFLVAFGVYLTEAMQMTLGTLIAASIISGRFMASIAGATTLFTRYSEMKKTHADLLNLIQPAPTHLTTLPPRELKGNFVIHELSWRFQANAPYLFNKLSFAIAPGEKIALVGRSGCGKSTLLRCLMGHIDPSEGEVLLDGIKVQAHSDLSIEQSIGYKPQELFLFNGSIEENILASAAIDDVSLIEHALNISGIGIATKKGEIQLDQLVQNDGVNLSGGQRQMVCLARVLVAHPDILILDEPTNGLDETSERHFMTQLMAYAHNKTIIISTHSRIILDFMDRIIALDGGKIVADGPRKAILQD